MSIVWVAAAKKVFASVWVLVWVVAYLGVYDKMATTTTDPVTHETTVQLGDNFAAVSVAMLVSLIWGKMVLAYAMHCTTAGTVASWWFQPHERSVVGPSLKRTFTTSFGSVSLAALIIAVLETLAAIFKSIKDSDSENAAVRILACCAECLLRCIEGFIKYFNKYAIAYCGIYGDSFCEAGGKVRTLFAQSFWDSVANENLIDWAFSLCCLANALICAAAGAIAGHFISSSDNNMLILLGALGFIMGYFFMFMQCSILTSGVVTVYICFAENKMALMKNHPEEYTRLTQAWDSKYPNGSLIWFGGAAFSAGGGFGV